METIIGIATITLRPVKQLFYINNPNFEKIEYFIRYSTTSIGGKYNCILFDIDSDFSKKIIEILDPDIIKSFDNNFNFQPFNTDQIEVIRDISSMSFSGGEI